MSAPSRDHSSSNHTSRHTIDFRRISTIMIKDYNRGLPMNTLRKVGHRLNAAVGVGSEETLFFKIHRDWPVPQVQLPPGRLHSTVRARASRRLLNSHGHEPRNN